MQRPRPSTGRAGSVTRVAGNVLPVVGVLAFGWSPAAVLGVYWLELVAVCVWTLPMIPVARKRPNNALGERTGLLAPLQAKRGSVPGPGPLPPVYLRNVPTLAAGLVLAPVVVGLGFVLFALTRPTITESVAAAMLLGGGVAFLGRGIETWRGYFRGGYREHSPRSVLLGPLKYCFGLGLLFVAVLLSEAAVAGPVLEPRAALLLLVVGKLAYDVRTIRLARDDERRSLFARLYGSERTEIDPEPVETPHCEPSHRVSSPRGAAVLDAVVVGLGYGFGRVGVVVWPLVGLGVLAGSAVLVVAGLGLGTVGALCRGVTRYLRYGTLSYHCYDDVLVAVDTLLDTPQSRMETHAVVSATVRRDWVDRLSGTESLSFDIADEGTDRPVNLLVPDPETMDTSDDANRTVPMTVRHVRDAEAVATALGVDQRMTD